MAGSIKTASGYNQNKLLLKRLYKFHIIFDRAAGKKIEGAGRLYKFIAAIGQTITQDVAFAFILGNLYTYPRILLVNARPFKSASL
jgi:hypothetical protein